MEDVGCMGSEEENGEKLAYEEQKAKEVDKFVDKPKGAIRDVEEEESYNLLRMMMITCSVRHPKKKVDLCKL